MTNRLRVSDVHQESVAEEFDRLSLLDLEDLLASQARFEDTGCPACHSESVVPAFQYQGLDYRRCNDCRLLYISPAPTEEMHLDYVVSSQAMAFWREQMPESMKQSRRPMYKERVDFGIAAMQRLNVSPTEVLELGAGNGEFAEELAAGPVPPDRIVVLEPQALNLDLPNLEVITGGFEELEKNSRKFDAVFAWELIEHILEPDHLLGLVHRALRPGCPFIFSTPNERSVETSRLGINSSNILFDHVRLYNPESIAKLLSRNGFKIVEITTPGKLDVERLQMFLKTNPQEFAEDPTLRFALTAGSETQQAFQTYLQENLLSGHMRVVAVPDGPWRGSSAPRLRQSGRLTVLSSEEKPTVDVAPEQAAPITFNKVVLGDELDPSDPYPPKLMKHILFGLLNASGGRFVDLGGGRGHLTKVVEGLGFDVLSLDREPPLVNVPYEVVDIANERMPLPDNSVDVLFSKSVFEHFYIHELPPLMSEAMRVLKPGAPMVVLTPDWEWNMKEFYRVFTHVTPYTKSSLHQCLTMYGFDQVRVDNLIQLPEIWNSKALQLLANAVSRLPIPRSFGKWARWSKERSVIGIGRKPVNANR